MVWPRAQTGGCAQRLSIIIIINNNNHNIVIVIVIVIVLVIVIGIVIVIVLCHLGSRSGAYPAYSGLPL